MFWGWSAMYWSWLGCGILGLGYVILGLGYVVWGLGCVVLWFGFAFLVLFVMRVQTLGPGREFKDSPAYGGTEMHIGGSQQVGACHWEFRGELGQPQHCA